VSKFCAYPARSRADVQAEMDARKMTFQGSLDCRRGPGPNTHGTNAGDRTKKRRDERAIESSFYFSIRNDAQVRGAMDVPPAYH
jgi:hypothetical protein